MNSAQIRSMSNEDKIKNWDRIISVLDDPEDMRYLEYIAIKVAGKDVKVVRFG